MADSKLMLVSERQLRRLIELVQRDGTGHADLLSALERAYEKGLSEEEANALLAAGQEEELGPFPPHVELAIGQAQSKLIDIYSDAE